MRALIFSNNSKPFILIKLCLIFLLSITVICVQATTAEIPNAIGYSETEELLGSEIDWSTDCGSQGNVTSLQLSLCFSSVNCTLVANKNEWYNLTVEYYPLSQQDETYMNIMVSRDGAFSMVHRSNHSSSVFPGKLQTQRISFQLSGDVFRENKDWNIAFRLLGTDEVEVCKTFLINIVGPEEEIKSSTTTDKNEHESSTSTAAKRIVNNYTFLSFSLQFTLFSFATYSKF